MFIRLSNIGVFRHVEIVKKKKKLLKFKLSMRMVGEFDLSN